ncbi:coiled-coil domain-containing protein 66 isoform X2 [Tiliqua scincoides]|uniref:coiled-coil domain-containing protein 66 isoform X2 n=1 Tax=Tiliqua scincoides TaxID=71010 RepID=UPI003461A9F1
MNLGDGLKLETEMLDGKPRLILASCVGKSKPSVKIFNKNRPLKHTLKTRQNGHVLKSVQTTCEKNDCVTKHKTGTRLSETKIGKNHETSEFTKDSSKEFCNKDNAFITYKDSAKSDNTGISVKKPLVSNKKFKKHPEDLRDNLVCLTQEQLEQILMAVKEGTKAASQLPDEKNKETNTSSLADQAPEEENIMGLLQKAGEAPSIPSENSIILNRKQGSPKHVEQKLIMNSWKPGDIFSTLGERERDKTLLDAMKSQWRKELDEQIALKKKLQEISEGESKYHSRQKTNVVKTSTEKAEMAKQAKMAFSDDLNPTVEDIHTCRILTTEASEASPSVSRGQSGQFSSFSSPDLPAAIRTAFVLGEATPLEHPFSAIKREQQKKWLEELDKQKEADKLRKIEEKYNLSKGEEHEKWTMHFDSFRNHMPCSSQYPLNTTYRKQPEALSLSPNPQDQNAFTPTALCHLTPTEVEGSGKAIGPNALEANQKTSFLRSMTALLDPAQIEEREKRRQKQLEHQKAIMAQVEEKRKKKQLEEEQRRREEQEEEGRLAREQELMKKQFEEDLFRQKQKEEIMTLKTNELYQTMQRAQELAQRLKQEQRIKELAQKGHDISKLQKNLGGGDGQYESYCTDLNGFSEVGNHHDSCSGENSSIINQNIKIILSPRKDTAVQTDSIHSDVHPSSEICTRQIGNGRMDSASPDICIEYKVDSNSKKCKKEPQNLAKKKISEKENIVSYSNLYEQLAENQKQAKPVERNGKRPDWNINKPCKRYIPASERYPRRLQKQREEKKARRQMELLQLVERNSPGNLSQKKGVSPDRSPSPLREEDKGEPSPKNNLIAQRSESPPVPAIKNKLQQQIKASDFPTHNSSDGREKSIHTDKQVNERLPPCVETERPPSSHFVPYVRTNEVYYLDPDAPMTRPSTHEPQYQQLNDAPHTPRQIFSSDHIRDPLFNPNVVRDRQQAILRGLSELRQGLLQKQKELETCLIPSTTSQEETFISPF